MISQKNLNLTVRTDEFLDLIKSSIQEVLQSELRKISQNNQDNELMTVEDAAKFFKVSPQSIYKWKKLNLIPYIKKQRKIYFTKSALMKHLQESNNLNTQRAK